MTRLLPTLTDEEISRCPPTSEEPGFGSLATTRGHLPLKALEVRARIDGLLAHLTLTQTFVNTHDEPLEATYIFPLPDRAAVLRFRMQVAGRVIEGQLKERGQARRDYDQAIQAGQRAAIAEEERPNVFTLRVGNLMPGEEATVRLNLVGPLPCSDGEATFRFPLVVAPRYIPGRPLAGSDVGAGTASDTDAVPDASRITPPVLLPGYPNPVRLSLTVDVYPSALPLHEFRCSLHSVLEAADDAGVRRIVLQPGERLNRDFILRFRLGEQTVRSSLILKPDRAGSQEGTFALTLVPPVGLAQAQRPRDLVFILDRSGSMGGWKMVAARRALARMVETLTDRDRFTVYAFDDRIETLASGNASLLPATDRQRYRAVEFLGGIEARGGTEMAQPLELAVHTLKGADPQREAILVLVTDGQVGNEDQILHHLGQRVRHLRIYALGIDQAVNEGLLRRLAALGRGSCELVESEQRLDEVMAQVHRHIGTPVLTNLHLEAAGLQIIADTLVPGRMPDLFAGAPLCLLGRYQGAAAGSLVLRARDATGQPWSATVKAEVCENPAVSSVWARQHIRELEDWFVIRGSDPQLEKRIVETSLRFGVLCRFTAFVAVDRTEVVNQGGQLHQATQAVETPAGWGLLESNGALDYSSEVLKIPAADFELSCRSRNCLKKMNIPTLGDLSRVSEQQSLSGEHFGETSLNEIKEMLAAKGLRLGQALDQTQSALPNKPAGAFAMRVDVNMAQRMEQKMVLAPRMIQSMEILQLPILALQERISQELQENSVLERKRIRTKGQMRQEDDSGDRQSSEGQSPSTTIPDAAPDLVVERNRNGKYQVRLVEPPLTKLTLSQKVLKPLRNKQTARKDREALERKIESARWLLEALEQRRAMLLRVTQAILEQQPAVLDKGPTAIVPLRMQQIADRLGVHVTTVSRAVQGKWIQTPHGIIALKEFFVDREPATDKETSWETIKQKILEIIEQEDRSNPLSDEELAVKLCEAGCPVSRRTVTQYRRMLNIPSSGRRKGQNVSPGE
jgi:Ca-activated chloride channel family protein